MTKLKHLSHQRWTLRTFLTGLLVVSLVSQLSASPLVTNSLTSTGGERSLIRVQEGSVSIKVAEAPLEDVLREIASQSRIRLVLQGSREEKISAEFQSVRLEEALRRLIKENFLLMYSPDGQLAGVVVLSFGTSVPSPFSVSLPAVQEPAQRVLQRENGGLHHLVEELHKGNQEERWKAVLALGGLKDENALEVVLWALKGDEDPAVREGAIWVLEKLGGPRAVNALTEAVSRDSDSFVRQTAVAALAKIDESKAVEPLTQALWSDRDPFVRYEALVNLVAVGGEHVRSALVRARKDPDQLVRKKAEEILKLQSNAGQQR
jgi:hypothetical protein